MSFLDSAVLLAWVALVLLALGLAGLLRQVTVLSRRQLTASVAAPPGRAPLTPRDLVGYRLPLVGDLAALPMPGSSSTVLVFVSPGCSSCSQTLDVLAGERLVRDGEVALRVLSTGSCGPAETHLSALPPDRCTCQERARPVMDALGVPATPYLMAVAADGTITAALLPHEGSDVAAWVRAARSPISLTEGPRG